MTYRPFVPHGTFIIALLFLSAAHALQAAPPNMVTMASEHAESCSHIQLGIGELLLGAEESARGHFRAAVTEDNNCALGWCGLMLTEGASEETRSALEACMAEGYVGTPQEEALMSSWLRLVLGDAVGAGEEFAVRAEQYRHDRLSAYWAIRLLHEGYESLGSHRKPSAQQQRALDIAQRVYEQYPQDVVACYLRAWVEESSPAPSDTALEAARQAAKLMAGHPSPHLLLGHLCYLRGMNDEALAALHEAATLVEKQGYFVPCGTNEAPAVGDYDALTIRAKLYESTLLWLQNKRRDSLLIQSDLLKQLAQIKPDERATQAAVLLHWEARTLPLRLLMLDRQVTSDKQLAAVMKTILPGKSASSHDPVLEAVHCLRFCLAARSRAAAGKGAEALKCLKAAEASFQRFDVLRGTCEGQGGYTLSAWTRLHEACQQAILAAKAAAYPDTADIWLQSMEDAQRPTSLLMPPVLPRVIHETYTK